MRLDTRTVWKIPSSDESRSVCKVVGINRKIPTPPIFPTEAPGRG